MPVVGVRQLAAWAIPANRATVRLVLASNPKEGAMESVLIALFLVLWVLWVIAKWLVNAFHDDMYRPRRQYRSWRVTPPRRTY